jgi:hypothetical protein
MVKSGRDRNAMFLRPDAEIVPAPNHFGLQVTDLQGTEKSTERASGKFLLRTKAGAAELRSVR